MEGQRVRYVPFTSHALLMCRSCHIPTWHDYVNRTPKAHGVKLCFYLNYECEMCSTQRVWGCEIDVPGERPIGVFLA